MLKTPQRENAKYLLVILNHYFKKICSKLVLDKKTNLWNEIFDKDGYIKKEIKDVLETNIYSTLDDDEITHFKKFMSFEFIVHITRWKIFFKKIHLQFRFI